MAKSSQDKIEEDAHLILDELQDNSENSINEIAKKYGFSRQKVWRIKKQLEENKTIWGYTAIIDYQKQDLKFFVLLIKRTINPVDQQLAEKIVSRDIESQLKEMGCNIVSSIYTNGSYDWIITFTCKELKEAKKCSELFIKWYSKYIEKIELIEELFPCKIQNIKNPNIKDLNKIFGL